MKITSAILVAFLTLTFFGCEIPQVMRPLRLYDLKDGTTIEVFLRRNSPNSGRLVSARVQGEKYEGEIVLYGGSPDYKPLGGLSGQYNAAEGYKNFSDDANLPELYGFGKETNAKPVGTAVLVGNQGTTIEIVLYRISVDLQYGDGVARDNKGRRYRVFLSVEG